MESTASPREPSLLDALIPLIALVVMLVMSVTIFKDNSSYGPNQISLLLCACIAGLVALKNGMAWRAVEKGFVKGISLALGAILILFAVGALIGSWILAGVVPTMIYFGLQILDPSIFYAATCLICAFIALSIGSSWTTAGTVGVGLMASAVGLNLSPEITAGAIISGAYFGDKMSPLSDTTNLAPAVAGSELFSHIHHMTWTTIPAIVLTFIIFLFLGISSSNETSQDDIEKILLALESSFTIGWYLLIPLVLVLVLAMKKVPAFPTILIGALIGCVFAAIFQQEAIATFVNDPSLSTARTTLQGVWTVLFDSFAASTDNEQLNELLSRGGMSSMHNTVWLIICAMSFGGVLEHTGLLKRIVQSILSMVSTTSALISATIASGIGTNIVTADQYISIILPGRMFREEYRKRKLAAVNLSRALEDSATLTSVLVPWNTCGAFMASTLGVATMAYFPYCFFNLITPIISILYGVWHIKIKLLEEEDAV